MSIQPDTDKDPDLETIEADTTAPIGEVTRRGTFDSFRHRNFTLFWSGALMSNIGSWMQVYALGVIVFTFRRSEFDLGLVNFLSGIPVLFLALPAGVLADRLDRRRFLLFIQVILGLEATALGVLYVSGILGPQRPMLSLVLVASLGLFAGLFVALQGPTFQSMVPDLVPDRLLMNAIALNSAQFQSSRLLGPLVAAALVVAGFGMGGVFFANAVSFLFVIAALASIRLAEKARAERHHAVADQGTWRALTAGVRYAKDHRAVGVLLLSTALTTVFGFPYMTLLPAIVSKTLHASTTAYPRWTAWIMAANGLGALAGALLVAGLPPTARRERIIPVAMLGYGVTLVLLSLSQQLWFSLVIAVVNGMMFLSMSSLTNTSIQAAAPGPIRGRVMALYVVSFMGMMPISGLLSGSIAEFTGAPITVLIGAAVILIWGTLLALHSQWICTETRDAVILERTGH